MTLDTTLALHVPSQYAEFAEPGQCYTNVRAKAAKRGGRAVFGWLKTDVIFDELPKIQTWVHHCIWESPEGDLFEITPFIKQILSEEILMASMDKKSIFIRDDTAQLTRLPDGRFQALPPKYTAIVDSEQVRLGIKYMENADRKLRGGDVRGEAYWCARAGAILGGEILPLAGMGLRTMAPFVLES